VERCGVHASGPGQGPVPGSCEHGNGPFGCMKAGGFVTG
jgi:hypothetical protein